ncbi:MAG TPA: hypothetical protein VIF62_27180 [Labilithrix sp.]|jgi:hypothetical protein
MRWISALALAMPVVACGLDAVGTAPVGADAGVDPAAHAGTPPSGSATPPQPQAPPGTPCGAAPAGWTRVGLSPDASVACPIETTTGDVVASATATPDACSCGCTIASHQTCTGGTIPNYYDNGSGLCETQASDFPNAPGGACEDNGNFFIDHHFKATAPPPQGTGVCTAAATLDSAKVTKTAARRCVPNDGTTCAVAPLRDCVEQDGDQTCPVDYAEKHAVFADIGATCGSCGSCSVTTKCTGTLTMSTSSSCGGGVTLNADGKCYPVSNTTLRYSKYVGTVGSEACTYANTNPPAMMTPTGQKTVCCK